MQAIALREPQPTDEEPLEAMITEHFTEDSSNDVDLGLDNPDRHVRVVEDADGTLLGVMALHIYESVDTLVEAMHMFDDTEPIPAADRYGHLQMGYVREEATGRGVGSRLMDRLHELGHEQDVDLFLADSWYHGGPDSPEKLFDRHGYETEYRSPIEDRTAEECPKCEEACTCEAAIAVRWVDS